MNPALTLKNLLKRIQRSQKAEPVTEGEAFMTDAPAGFLKRIRQNPKVVVLVLVALGTGALIAKPVYHRVIFWRAQKLVDKATKQIEAQDLAGAFLTVRAAYLLAPLNHDVVRSVARVLALNGDPTALDFWKMTVNSPEATLDDRRQLVETSLQAGKISPEAETQLRFLLEKEPGSARNWFLAARMNEFYGAPERVLLCARRAHELDPRMDDATLFLAVLLLKSPDSTAEGTDLLWTVIENNGKNSLRAALFASQLQTLSSDRMEFLIKRLKTDPGSTESHRLQALELELRMHPDDRLILLDAAEKSASNLDKDSLRELGAWFNANGEPGRTLRVVPVDRAEKDRNLFLVYLDALASLKQWEEVSGIISKKGIPLEPFALELFKARCAMELGTQEEAVTHWRAAQSAAIGNPDQSFYVAKYIRQFGRTDQAKNIYRSLTQTASNARAAYLELLNMEAANGTEAIYSILVEMRARWPGLVRLLRRNGAGWGQRSLRGGRAAG